MEQRLTPEQRKTLALEQMGVTEALGLEPLPFWRRAKCRILGPHEWVTLLRHDVSLSETTEEGVICHICQKVQAQP